MLSSLQLPKLLTRRLHRQIIALVQIVVMLALVVPVCVDSVAVAGQEEIGISMSIDSGSADSCPCCPDEDSDKSSDNCSLCSFCSSFLPLVGQVVIPPYAPLVADLVVFERLARLPEVHIPIFIPPRLA